MLTPANWLRHLTQEQNVMGSNPARNNFFFDLFLYAYLLLATVVGGTSYCGFERKKERKKNAKVPFSEPLGSVRRRRFCCVTMDSLGVKLLIELDFEG